MRNRKDYDFDSDRPSKRIFTASTYAYYTEHGYTKYPIEFFEMGNDGKLIPFDSPEAKTTAREDVFVKYGNKIRAYELKEVKKYPSNIWFKVLKGVICATEKFPAFDELYAASGIPTSWVEIYPMSDDIRIWDLYGNFDKDSIQHDDFVFPEIGIDPTSPKVEKDRGLLRVEDAVTIPIIIDKKDKLDDQ